MFFVIIRLFLFDGYCSACRQFDKGNQRFSGMEFSPHGRRSSFEQETRRPDLSPDAPEAGRAPEGPLDQPSSRHVSPERESNSLHLQQGSNHVVCQMGLIELLSRAHLHYQIKRTLHNRRNVFLETLHVKRSILLPFYNSKSHLYPLTAKYKAAGIAGLVILLEKYVPYSESAPSNGAKEFFVVPSEKSFRDVLAGVYVLE